MKDTKLHELFRARSLLRRRGSSAIVKRLRGAPAPALASAKVTTRG
jgi:hypothetical protein